MIVKDYIKRFEKMGFGLFVHFGAYSLLGRGEWAKHFTNMPWDEYMTYVVNFNPKSDWAQELVAAAKSAGARYITLTTRHHDGFSLYDTCGLTDYDTVHTCGRDLVREFVDACREEGIVPFFYHTLLDWHEESYQKDFKQYLVYLRKSVEILCKNYGEIGGLWFDGQWNKPHDDWEEDALYSMIRSYQPNAMIINNTGLSAQGALGHIELDSVTFERGLPKPINLAESPKYIASEMCQIFGSHWGFAANDFNYKGVSTLIRDLAVCRRYGSNYLLNVGPRGDGSLRPIDTAMLGLLGEWVYMHEEMLDALPAGIPIENHDTDYLLQKNGCYYLVCTTLAMRGDPNVALAVSANHARRFTTDRRVARVTWLDNKEELSFTQDGNSVTVTAEPFSYGTDLVIRVAKIELE